MDYVIRNEWGFNAHTHHIREFLGYKAGYHLPDHHEEKVIQGHRVVILTKEEARAKSPGKIRPHRIMQVCPAGCGLIPVGRMHQHCKIHPDHEKKFAVKP